MSIWSSGQDLSGSVMMTGISSSAVCAAGDKKVYLHKLNSDGSVNEIPVATTSINSDYSYTFVAVAGVDSTTAANYILKADACGKKLTRPVTGLGSQNITYASSIVGLIPYVQDATVKKLQSVKSENIESVISMIQNAPGVGTSESMSEVYDALNTAGAATQKANFVATFNLNDITKLVSMVPPYIDTFTAPNSYEELSAANHTVTAAHWYGSYAAAYDWILNGTSKSTTSSFSLTPTKNSQGSQTLLLKIGTDNGSGSIDTSYAVFEKEFTLSINNTFPPIAPTLTLTSAAVTNSANITFDIDTGPSLINCQTFTNFAISESATSAGVALSAFNQTCSTDTTQSLNYTLSTGQGIKKVYLWSKDSAGNISSTPSYLTVTYDTEAPTVSLSGVPTVIPGATAMSLSFSATDATSGIAAIKLQYSSDGTTYSDVATLTSATSPYNSYTPTASGYLRLYAIDNAGNSTTTTPAQFTYDNTPPAAPSITLTTAAITKSTSVGFTLANCTDTSMVLITEATGAPSGSSTSWVACSTSAYNYTISSSEGSHTIYVWAKDAAGNISTTAGNVAVILDTTVPTLTWTAPTTDLKVNTSATVSWKVTDLHTSTSQNVILQYSDDSGTTWNTISTQALPATSAANTAYNATWSTPSTLKTVTLKVTATDAAGNSSSITKNLIVESERPVLNSLTLADGATTVGISSVNAAISVTPSTSATAYMRFAETDFDPNTDNGVGWIPYSTDKMSFSLSTVAGNHTVYAQVKNNAGIMSLTKSYTVKLEFGTPPQIKVAAPTGSGTYLPGQTMTISWQCQSSDASVNLATRPISSIQYTVNDGLSYFVITDDTTSNLPATGSYAWTIPSAAPDGTAISASTPIRVLVACKTEGGVITTALSAIQNSKWQVLIGDPGNLEYGVHLSAADTSTWNGVYADSQNNLYSGSKLRHAIIKVDRQTGILSEWLGGLNTPGCPTSSSAVFTIPRILDVTSDEMTIVSGPCHTITRVRISDKSIVWNRTVPLISWDDRLPISNPAYDVYLKSGYYFFPTFTSANTVVTAYYELDMNNVSSSPKLIIGNGTSCGGVPNVGDVADTIQVPCRGGLSGWITAVPDGSVLHIWDRSTTSSAYRTDLTLDTTTQKYKVTASSGSTDSMPCSRSVFMGTDTTKMFCMNNVRSGNKVSFMDAATGVVSATTATINAFKFTDFQASVGSSSSAIYVTARETNELFELKYNNSAWTVTKIGGTPFLNYGNGTSPSLVAFTSIAGLAWDSVNKFLYTRGVRHVRRMQVVVPANGDPAYIGQIDSAYPSLIGTSLNTFGAMVANKNGTRVAINSGTTGGYNWNALDITGWSLATDGSPGSSGLHTGLSGGYPTLGTAFNQNTKLIWDWGSTATYLSDGMFYFIGYSSNAYTSSLFLFKSDPGSSTNSINSIAGATGTPTSGSITAGQSALGTPLLRVYGMQAGPDGELWIFDGNKLRKITAIADSANPKIYDLIDFSTYSNFPSGKTWIDAVYDNSTGWSYMLANDVTNGITEVYAARASEGFVKIPTTGLNLPGTTPGARGKAFYLQITPLGLLMQDAYKRRILSTPLMAM